MTWNPNIPSANESPGRLPGQAATNWARLQAIITKDHYFATSTDTTEGYHNIVHWINQGSALGSGTPAPLAGYAQLYTKTITTTGLGASTAGAGEQICFQRGTGGGAAQEASLTASPVRACVNFQGLTSPGACTIQWGFNVSNVQRLTNPGEYRVDFNIALPSIYYAPFAMGMPHSLSTGCIAQIHKATYSTSFTTTTFFVDFFPRSGSGRDPQFASVVIFGG